MTKKKQLNDVFDKLTEKDIYTIVLFSLYLNKDTNTHFGDISKLTLLLDSDKLTTLASRFGGTTLYIPTLSELKTAAYTLLVYKECLTKGICFDDAVNGIELPKNVKKADIKNLLLYIQLALEGYDINV